MSKEVEAIKTRSSERKHLIDAIYEAFDELYKSGIREDMIGIVAGGLQFLVTGEDGEWLTDADLQNMVNREDALAAMLFCDLKRGWQGFPCEEDRENAWKVCNAIAAAFCKALEAV